MLGAGHPHASRVLALLRAARDAASADGFSGFGAALIGMDVTLSCPGDPASDATNYLGGIGDVLEAKGHRGVLDHLGDLYDVALFDNDRQIREVHYRHESGEPVGYTVRFWELG